MRFTITNCPNTPEVHEALAVFKTTDTVTRKRGRGKGYGSPPYTYSMPAHVAERFTLYVDSKKGPPGGERYSRLTFVGLEPSGKPRVRLLKARS